jgi:hypothetical protein
LNHFRLKTFSDTSGVFFLYLESANRIIARDAPDTDFAGYPAKPKAGYRISGRILGLTNIFLKYQINLLKQL